MERLPLSGAGAYFSIHREDWSLHRQGPIDQARHNEKVKEAIKENLGNIIAEEAIITSDGKSIVKVPIRGLELPRFRYTQGEQGVGQGAGDSQIGDVVGTVPAPGTNGEPRHAGEQPGVDYYDAEITVDELAELMFRDLELPNLQPKRLQEIETEAVSYYEVRKSGPMATLNKRRTALANIKRNALQRKKPVIEGVQNEDLRFRASTNSVSQESNAVVLAMRDVSGSMGEFEKYITRSVYFWMTRFLRTKYNNVNIVFITHHAEAKEVDEETFFNLGESGDTKVSSAYQLALDIIKERFDPNAWNIYPFHFSDGDNWGDSDNKGCRELMEKLLAVSSMAGYGEINEGGRYSVSTLMGELFQITNPKFVRVSIADKKDVYPALKQFFAKEGIEGLVSRA